MEFSRIAPSGLGERSPPISNLLAKIADRDMMVHKAREQAMFRQAENGLGREAGVQREEGMQNDPATQLPAAQVVNSSTGSAPPDTLLSICNFFVIVFGITVALEYTNVVEKVSAILSSNGERQVPVIVLSCIYAFLVALYSTICFLLFR